MTRYLLDVASWQGSLKPADVKRAGFSAVNLKISHGLTTEHVHPNITGWIAACRDLGLQICTFHYFTADATGQAQAAYAHERMRVLGLLEGTGHQMDVESSPVPALSSVRSYLTTMTALLQRPVALYTGDWWWTARPGWNVSDLAPYLWAAPNARYPGTYPGDDSADWHAGYGGWANLAIMQYSVAPLSFPDGTRGTIAVSKSAIRDESVWQKMTGDDMPTSQNGWPVVPDSSAGRAKLAELILPGNMPHHVYVLAGDVATVFEWLVRQYQRRVESITPAECWGWNVRKIEGSDDWSNHSAACALDINAPDNPMGQGTTARSMTAAQIDTCHALERESDGVLRWGGDFGRNDPMHWEIVGDKAETAAFASKIRSEEDDMPLTDADVDKILNRDAIPNLYSDAPTNPTITVKTALKAGTSADIRVRALADVIAANASGEARRDAEQSAQIQQLITLVQAVTTSSGVLSPEQWAELQDAMASAAMQAGETAAARVEAKVDSLRHHLGDDTASA